MTIGKALTIAGSDSGGGAGIQADLKTFQELNVFGMSAITAVTAQNTLGVHGVYPLSVEAVVKQIEAIGTDLGADAVKTGMLFSSEIIQAVSECIIRFKWENIVVDPVMIAKGGASLLQNEAIAALKKHLLPLAMVITPNIPEAEVLADMSIDTIDDRLEAAKRLHQLGAKHVVMKGGHGREEELVDILYDGVEFTYFKGKRMVTKNTHGTGCTFAAAVTAELAKGKSVKHAVETAKRFIQAAIEDDLEIGSGHGPTNHWAYQKRQRGVK
ncbi:bifunctional hydroxymethylpyrimidine kinase/phosphomethylpyrimidine kinase [Metabacillus sediminilitoris]|uniref:Hydroxymethylpyrimidine/phosphomethylpyrimidine kinase n=1 Tax=Metabacillus sediminilitoris TaxID=2567941 RepID=A0A4S4BUF4_9BACI|nr:bifunctional hydroxymethylpyrimidine kinase/phosphomethylpyrimidine kinase [Metabacillus sediminilitoris]QGQ44937.1 bifunctional hydroxymethylpyrimidine kinase/phosphomethylpyrimidine kinase [Metabacillus sediminilitoris]THF78570.1 bifunctional hydroxymethylpyrimidine kinase/phosphomethylpyrimidine kinase [Metabacillus sediminilitoris]